MWGYLIIRRIPLKEEVGTTALAVLSTQGPQKQSGCRSLPWRATWKYLSE
jgi:hypothetical protein